MGQRIFIMHARLFRVHTNTHTHKMCLFRRHLFMYRTKLCWAWWEMVSPSTHDRLFQFMCHVWQPNSAWQNQTNALNSDQYFILINIDTFSIRKLHPGPSHQLQLKPLGDQFCLPVRFSPRSVFIHCCDTLCTNARVDTFSTGSKSSVFGVLSVNRGAAIWFNRLWHIFMTFAFIVIDYTRFFSFSSCETIFHLRTHIIRSVETDFIAEYLSHAIFSAFLWNWLEKLMKPGHFSFYGWWVLIKQPIFSSKSN